ncbi:hypothetical protein BOTBODRAFT_34939 [Botryobasidium botryosum FD-172 SS1]|uniref:Uncharacterized protein n=1 Tax=Botryobasidium botryosum (strain FD-172 SS1) TaxID=930990 RepID=A0A067M7X9_BOTB1|nr:hypothetical protein BOTBODRAFT_34939 [Botryobasidium botryosum FD-172 SS1]
MYYFLSFLTFLGLFALAFYFRARILPHLPVAISSRLPASLSTYTPLSTFEDQRSAGLSSSTFDIEQNMVDGDSRSGLDDRAAEEIRRIMLTERVGFDQARLIRHQRILAQNGIDPQTGMPLDAKAVTRL